MAKKKAAPKARSPLSFFKQAKVELKKVTWPTRAAALKMTVIVIVVSLTVGLYIGLLDYLLIKLMGIIIK